MSSPERSIRATWIANLLSLARVPLAALIWIAPGHPIWVTAVVVTAGLTDMLDGWSARRLRRWWWEHTHDPGSFAATTGVGAWLDPACDKLFVVSTFGAITWGFQPPAWCVALVVTREIVMLPAVLYLYAHPREVRERVDFTADWPGKATTVAQFLAMATIVYAQAWLPYVALVAAALGAFTAVYYIRREVQALRS